MSKLSRFALISLLSFAALTSHSPAQTPTRHVISNGASDGATIPALMISDIHFDPFHDPAKFPLLADAPISKWTAILAAPPSPDQQQAFDALQQQCKARGVDTPYELLQSSLRAMHARQPGTRFMTVSGDLIAHAFTCRYQTLRPKASQADYEAFVLKTLTFVLAQLRAFFPGMPVYPALGNNDSNCGDYKLDINSRFLAQLGSILAAGLPSSEEQDASRQFAVGGYYNIKMAAPMHETRIIAVNDLFLSPKYTTCGNLPDTTAAGAEMDWLNQQLTDAQKSGQKVWIIGHIPPGIDPYSTVAKLKNVCTGASPVMFLSSGKMADVLVEHAATIRLAIFAHTHMDELRLLQPEDGDPSPTAEHSVAIKMASSISPVDGNNPSFTVARVDPATATLADYEVFTASNQTGIATMWSSEYDFDRTYHQASFTSATVKQLIAGFQADHNSQQETSNAYIHNYFIGDRSTELKPFWPQYVCSLANSTAKSYAACVCTGNK